MQSAQYTRLHTSLLGWVLGTLLSGELLADSMRCGRALVRDGDSVAKLIRRCGQPSSQYRSKATGRYVEAGTALDNWVYDRGRQRPVTVMVSNGVIVAISVR